jgi:hypothetical protein
LNSASAPAAIFPDLIGFRPLDRNHRIDWTRFFDANGRPPAGTKRERGALPRGLQATPPYVFYFSDHRGWYLAMEWLTIDEIRQVG